MARRDDFPEVDINQSTMNDMLKQCATDERQIKEMLVREERESRIKELQSQFTAIPREVIVQVLSGQEWVVERAILPLFNVLEKYQKVQEDEIKKQADLRQSQMPRPDDKIKIETVEPKVESPFKENAVAAKPVEETKQAVTLKATPAHVDIKNPISVTWELTSGESSPYDWIGLFQLENPNKNYLTYQWRGPNDKGCTLTFPAPTTYGSYEFRYLPYGSYTHIAISNAITVGPKVQLECKKEKDVLKVNWSAQVSNDYSNAWIGLYKCGETNHKNFITWEYAKSSEIILTCPVTPDNYEIRYFPYSYTHVATSNQVKVEGNDTVEIVKKTENGVTVKVGIVTKDPYYDSIWIGMYEVSEVNNKNLKRYKWIKERFSDNIEFSVPSKDVQYEFRVFANKNYDSVLVKSLPFNV